METKITIHHKLSMADVEIALIDNLKVSEEHRATLKIQPKIVYSHDEGGKAMYRLDGFDITYNRD